ncbi:hypothetical protein BC829DRAFT_400078, partial [Chytridium lagenaria]
MFKYPSHTPHFLLRQRFQLYHPPIPQIPSISFYSILQPQHFRTVNSISSIFHNLLKARTSISSTPQKYSPKPRHPP